MPVFAILAAVGVLFAVFEMQKQTASAPVSSVPPPPPPFGGFAPNGGMVMVGGSVVDSLAPTAINDVAAEASNLLASTSKSLSSAIPIVGGIIASVAGALLAQHTARMKDAQTENQAVATAIPNWLADFQIIARAGNYSRAVRIQQCRLLDQQTKAYLQKQVGKPGTAWNGVATGCPGTDVSHSACLDGGADGPCGGPHPCDKTCTVGCCIYYNYLEPAVDCLAKRIAAGGARAVGIPSIPGNKYGFPVFPAVTVQIIPSRS